MKPDGDQLLRVLGATLMGEIAPQVDGDYPQRSLMMSGMLLAAAAEEWDRAAARRVEENAALRALFAEAAPHVADAGLRSRLEDAAGAGETGLQVAELEAANAELRALLIELHAHVEALETPEARRVEAAIWRELRASTERRKLSISPF